MATQKYITLANSNASLVKRFRVLHDGYAPSREKLGARRVTVTGKLDNQVGPVLRSWQFTLKVYETDPTDPNKADADNAGYGLISHLGTFFEYNSPGGAPTNIITFTEHDDTQSHSVYISGTMKSKALTYSLTGTSGIFYVPMLLAKTTAE